MLAAMRKAGAKPLTVSIVGLGNLGTALALTLPRAGCNIKFIAVRSRGRMPSHTAKLARQAKAKLVGLGETPLDTKLVWITIPDDAIAAVAARLAPNQEWRGRTVFHSSGALTSDALAPLREL